MRYFLLFCILLMVGFGCTDHVRQSYDMPDTTAEIKNFDDEIILTQLSGYIRSNPDHYNNYLKRALIYLKQDEYESALEDINLAEQLNPNSGEVLFVKSNIQYRMGDKDALKNALFAEDEGYDFPNLYTLIAKLYLKEEEREKADEYIRHAENIYPYNPEVYFTKGMYFASTGDTTASIFNYRRALEQKPENYEYNDNLIKLYTDAGMVDSALVLNEKAMKTFQQKSSFVYNKALILERSGYGDAAINSYREYMHLEPERTDIFDKIGQIYLRRGSFSLGIKNYQDWVKAEPDNMKARLGVSNAYRAQGSYYSARSYMEDQLNKYPDNDEFIRELSLINSILQQQQTAKGGMSQDVDKKQSVDDIRIFKKSIEIKKIPDKTTVGTGNN